MWDTVPCSHSHPVSLLLMSRRPSAWSWQPSEARARLGVRWTSSFLSRLLSHRTNCGDSRSIPLVVTSFGRRRGACRSSACGSCTECQGSWRVVRSFGLQVQGFYHHRIFRYCVNCCGSQIGYMSQNVFRGSFLHESMYRFTSSANSSDKLSLPEPGKTHLTAIPPLSR